MPIQGAAARGQIGRGTCAQRPARSKSTVVVVRREDGGRQQSGAGDRTGMAGGYREDEARRYMATRDMM
eukprot:scaffold986_cov285-Prasinococcus_capsulatus_cf.AAC.4